MIDVGLAVPVAAGMCGERLVDRPAEEQGAHWLIASAQSLGERDDVRCPALLLVGEERTGAAHAAHYFIEDEEDAVAVRSLARAGSSRAPPERLRASHPPLSRR